jgi:hypothetical protein
VQAAHEDSDPATPHRAHSQGQGHRGALWGQQCVYSGPDGNGAIDVLVIKGKQYYKQDVRDSHLTVAVPGIGDKAARAKGDFQIDALKGDEFCSVSVGSSDTIPGVAALEDAANGTSDIPENANATIAKALGTVCNRLFKKGNTTPSSPGSPQPPRPARREKRDLDQPSARAIAPGRSWLLFTQACRSAGAG